MNLIGRSKIALLHVLVFMLPFLAFPQAPTLILVTVSNDCPDPIWRFWLNQEGEEINYGPLHPKTNSEFQTYPSHRWRLRSVDGTLLRAFTAPDVPLSITVTNPGGKEPPLQLHLSSLAYQGSSDRECSFGFPRNPLALPSVGEVNYAVLFADFPDAPADGKPEAIFSKISPFSEEYFEVVSYGKMKLNFRPYFHWLRFDRPSKEYRDAVYQSEERIQHVIQEAVDKAGKNIQWEKMSGVAVLIPPKSQFRGKAFCGSKERAIRANGKWIYSATLFGLENREEDAFVFPHECGHNLSLPDLYDVGGTYVFDSLTQKVFSTNRLSWNDIHRFVGGWSVMGLVGAFAKELFGFERWQLGWLQDEQVHWVRGKVEEFKLTPIEKKFGIKLGYVPLSRTKGLFIESRHKMGYDYLFKSGALVYTVDAAIPTGNGPLKVLGEDKVYPPFKQFVPLSPGESLTAEGYKISVLKSKEDGELIRVEKN